MELEVISSTFSLGPRFCPYWRKKSTWEYSETGRPRHPKNWLNTLEFALPAVGVCHMVIWEACLEMEELWNWACLLQVHIPVCAFAGLPQGRGQKPKIKSRMANFKLPCSAMKHQLLSTTKKSNLRTPTSLAPLQNGRIGKALSVYEKSSLVDYV